MIAGGDSVVSKVSEVTDGGLRVERFFLHSNKPLKVDGWGDTDPLFGIHKRPEKIHSLLLCVDDILRRGVQDDAFVVTVSPSFLYILLRPLQKKLLEFQKVVL